MELVNVHRVYFLGIGGIGMSALARYFLWAGKKVYGYDKVCTDLTRELELQGIEIHYEDDPSRIPAQIDLAIYTPAVPQTMQEYLHLKQSGIPFKKRAEVLGMISRHIPTIAIAGTHGKTTVSTMVAHILQEAGVPFSAFLGGISANTSSNFVGSGNPQWMVVEADEFDRSFLHLSPQLAVITSMDADHLDVYGNAQSVLDSFALFAQRIQDEGVLVCKNSLKKPDGYTGNFLTYGLSLPADFLATDIQIQDGKYQWKVLAQKPLNKVGLGMPGRHNLENAMAAIAVCTQAGVAPELIGRALETYKGVRRRFDLHIHNGDMVYIDDYAHHPKELEACISSVRELFPGRKLTGIFQPHLYSRTRDFADEFALALSTLDELILTEIYPARELPLEGVNARMLLDKVPLADKKLIPMEKLEAHLAQNRYEVLLTLGAGDIDTMVKPIIKLFGV